MSDKSSTHHNHNEMYGEEEGDHQNGITHQIMNDTSTTRHSTLNPTSNLISNSTSNTTSNLISNSTSNATSNLISNPASILLSNSPSNTVEYTTLNPTSNTISNLTLNPTSNPTSNTIEYNTIDNTLIHPSTTPTHTTTQSSNTHNSNTQSNTHHLTSLNEMPISATPLENVEQTIIAPNSHDTMNISNTLNTVDNIKLKHSKQAKHSMKTMPTQNSEHSDNTENTEYLDKTENAEIADNTENAAKAKNRRNIKHTKNTRNTKHYVDAVDMAANSSLASQHASHDSAYNLLENQNNIHDNPITRSIPHATMRTRSSHSKLNANKSTRTSIDSAKSKNDSNNIGESRSVPKITFIMSSLNHDIGERKSNPEDDKLSLHDMKNQDNTKDQDSMKNQKSVKYQESAQGQYSSQGESIEESDNMEDIHEEPIEKNEIQYVEKDFEEHLDKDLDDIHDTKDQDSVKELSDNNGQTDSHSEDKSSDDEDDEDDNRNDFAMNDEKVLEIEDEENDLMIDEDAEDDQSNVSKSLSNSHAESVQTHDVSESSPHENLDNHHIATTTRRIKRKTNLSRGGAVQNEEVAESENKVDMTAREKQKSGLRSSKPKASKGVDKKTRSRDSTKISEAVEERSKRESRNRRDRLENQRQTPHEDIAKERSSRERKDKSTTKATEMVDVLSESLETWAETLIAMKNDTRHKNQIIWAKVKGFPSWPAKVIDVKGNKLKVAFFGEDTISQVLPRDTQSFKVADAKVQLEKYQKRAESDSSREKRDLNLKLCQAIKIALEDIAGNSDTCCVCHESGFLICCDGCSNACHLECAGLSSVPDESTLWFCNRCKESGVEQEELTQRRNDANQLLQSADDPYLNEYFMYQRRDPLIDIVDRYHWNMISSNSRNRKRKYEDDDDRWKNFKKQYTKKKAVSKRAQRAKRRKRGVAFAEEEEENEYDPTRITKSIIHTDIKCMKEERPILDENLKIFGNREFVGQKIVRWYWEGEKDFQMFFPEFINDDIPILNFEQLWDQLQKEDSRISTEICDLRYWCEISKGWVLITRVWEHNFHTHPLLTLRLTSQNNSTAPHLYCGAEYLNHLRNVT